MKISVCFLAVTLAAVAANVLPESPGAGENGDEGPVTDERCFDVAESALGELLSWFENEVWKSWGLRDWWNLLNEVDVVRRYALKSEEALRLRRSGADDNADISEDLEAVDVGVQCINKYARGWHEGDDYHEEYRSSAPVAEFIQFFQKIEDSFYRFLRNSVHLFRQIDPDIPHRKEYYHSSEEHEYNWNHHDY